MSLRNIIRCFWRFNTTSGKFIMTERDFPKSLKEFGYEFDKDGKLRKLDSVTNLLTSEGFEFNVSNDPQYNQKRYEVLGEIIDEYVYSLLENEGLKRLPLPKTNSTSLDNKSFVFATTDMLENEKLIVLINGSGVVRAGQWARRLIINDNIKTGTQIPYIRKAKELGYAVLVLNTNDNDRIIDGKSYKILGSKDPHEHLETAWKDYIQVSEAKYVAIVAHSYGGECVKQFVMKCARDFKSKAFAVALTDSIHIAPLKGFEYIIQIAKNWVCSNKPLNTPVLTPSGDIKRVSAGHVVHEMSSSSCIDSVFSFIEDRYRLVKTEATL